MFNSYDSIISHDFIQHLPQDKNYIICTDGILGKNLNNIKRYSFDYIISNPNEVDMNWWNLICIAEFITAEDIIQLDQLLDIPCTWINLNPGVMSMISKKQSEKNDIILMLKSWYTIKEPISLENLISSILPKIYIRAIDTPVAEILSKLKQNSGITYLSGSLEKSHITVLSTVSCSDNVAGAIKTASKGSDNIFEFYIRSEITTNLSNDLIESIKKTEHVIIIMDHKATEEIWIYCDALIKQYCGQDITIQYIFPQFHLISSILPEYIYEEARFDQPAIEAYIAETIDNYNTQNN